MDAVTLMRDVLVAVAVSVITSWLFNKYYRQFNRVRFQEEMKISGSAQVFAYNVTGFYYFMTALRKAVIFLKCNMTNGKEV